MDELGVAIVHLHVYMYTYMYTHMYTYMYTYAHTRTHTLHCLVEKNGLALLTDELRVASLRHFPTTSFPSCQVVLLCKRLQLNASECHIVLLSGVSEWDIVYFLVVMCLGLTMLHCVLSELQIYVGTASSSLI